MIEQAIGTQVTDRCILAYPLEKSMKKDKTLVKKLSKGSKKNTKLLFHISLIVI